MKWTNLKFFKTYQNISDYLEYRVKDVEVYPPIQNRFKAFDLTPFDKVKCVILGQDPYPTKGHAHGLAFSCLPHVKPLPLSLINILSEYSRDLGYAKPRTGCLEPWAKEGVLLLNTILTVEEGKPLSHAGIGWEKLTYEVLSELSEKRTGVVFMLWGKKAQEYSARVDTSKHLLLTAPHPSPRSRGFMGCKHFSLANKYRKEKGLEEINWKLP